MPETLLPFNSLAAYLAARKEVIEARSGFFFAIQTMLLPEQRKDARLLGDPLWNSPARLVDADDWVANAGAGYLIALENPDIGRPYRFFVHQYGISVTVEIQLPYEVAVAQSISKCLPDVPMTFIKTRTGSMLRWNFDVHDLYKSVLAYETAVHRVAHIFEAGIQHFSTKI